MFDESKNYELRSYANCCESEEGGIRVIEVGEVGTDNGFVLVQGYYPGTEDHLTVDFDDSERITQQHANKFIRLLEGFRAHNTCDKTAIGLIDSFIYGMKL